MALGSAAPSAHLLAATTSGGVTTTTSAPIFLIPNGTFVVELVLFVVVLGIVAKFILPPITGAMDERARKVSGALQAGDEAQDAAEQLAAERRHVLEAARSDARALLDDAATAVEGLLAEARESGQAEHARILAEATPRIAAERSTVESELLSKMDELVVAAASQVIGAELDAGRHRQVIDDAVARAAAGSAPVSPTAGT
jgi:F-type H+-transporting ATPase subunit b